MKFYAHFFFLQAKSHMRQSGGILGISYFIALIGFLPILFISGENHAKQILFPLIIISFFLTLLATLERLFAKWRETGQLEQFQLAALPLGLIVFLSFSALWISLILPLVFLGAALLYFALGNAACFLTNFYLLILFSWASLQLCGFCAALSAGLPRAASLLMLLALPLHLPLFLLVANFNPGPTSLHLAFWSFVTMPAAQLLLAAALLSSLISLYVTPWALRPVSE